MEKLAVPGNARVSVYSLSAGTFSGPAPLVVTWEVGLWFEYQGQGC